MSSPAALEETGYWDQSIRRSTSRLFLLAALAQRPMHGYELARAVERLSASCCSPSDAALYPSLRDLEAGGYIVCHSESHGGRRRNVCTLTDRGRDALAAGARAWARVLPSLSELIEDAPDDCCEASCEA